MTITTVTSDELQQLSFDSGAPIYLGAHHTASVLVGDDLFVARSDVWCGEAS